MDLPSSPGWTQASGIQYFANSRPPGNGGGLALFIDHKYPTQIFDLKFSPTSPIEFLFVNIAPPAHKDIIIGVLYRPPNSDLKSFNSDLDHLLQSLSNLHRPCYLCGDFNIDLLNADSHSPSDTFLNTMSSSFFHPLITQPTRLTPHSATLIDNIFSNVISSKELPGILRADISDHFPVFLILE